MTSQQRNGGTTPMMGPQRSRRPLWLCAVAVLLASACSGGGSSSPSGDGSGLGDGTVTGFGSIIVDGVRYDDKDSRITIDTVPGAPDAVRGGVDVKLGQHVELSFSGAEGSRSAGTVAIVAELVGQVSAVTPDLVVAGRTVKINADAAAGPVTVFDGYTSSAGITPGDRVEVHGQASVANGVAVLLATRIERRPVTETWVRVSGTLAGLAADQKSFQLGALTVTLGNSSVVLPSGALLVNGQRVVVWSESAVVGTTLTAKVVRIGNLPSAPDRQVHLGGPVSGCTPPCAAGFKLGGWSVNAATAEFINGSRTDLANGQWIDVTGSVDSGGSDLINATRVTYRRLDTNLPDVSLRGTITDYVDASNFRVRGVPVSTDAQTRINASCPSPLVNGTIVTIMASIRADTVLAKTIDCSQSPDGFTVIGVGLVQQLDKAAKTFTLDGDLFNRLTLRYSDSTDFRFGTAADLKIGSRLVVMGHVNAGVLQVSRIMFANEPLPPVTVDVLETEGTATHLSRSGDSLTGLQVGALQFVVNAATVIVPLEGPVVEGAKVHVVFRKVEGSNIALLINTRH